MKLAIVAVLLLPRISEAGDRVPEAYGWYVLSGDQLVELRPQEKPKYVGEIGSALAGVEEPSGIEIAGPVDCFYVYHPKVDILSVELCSLEFETRRSLPGLFGDRLVQVNMYVADSPIQLRVIPNKDIADLYRIEPGESLSGGQYALHTGVLTEKNLGAERSPVYDFRLSLGDQEEPAPTEDQTPELIGVWTGTGEQVGGSTWDLRLSIEKAPSQAGDGEEVGSISYPSLGCSGVLTKSEAGLRERITDGQDSCVDNGRVKLTAGPSPDQIKFDWYFPDGRWGAAATLHKVPDLDPETDPDPSSGPGSDTGPIEARYPLPAPYIEEMDLLLEFCGENTALDKEENTHTGIDIGVPTNTPVFALCDGLVEHNHTSNPYWDSFLIVRHQSGERSFFAYYGHIVSSLQPPTEVDAGDSLGSIRAPEPSSLSEHLHLAITIGDDWDRRGWGYDSTCVHAGNDGYVDPLKTLRFVGAPSEPEEPFAIVRFYEETPLYESLEIEKVRPDDPMYWYCYPGGEVLETLGASKSYPVLHAYANDSRSEHTLKIVTNAGRIGYVHADVTGEVDVLDDRGALFAIQVNTPYEYECSLSAVDAVRDRYASFLNNYPESAYGPGARIGLIWLDIYVLQCRVPRQREETQVERVLDNLGRLTLESSDPEVAAKIQALVGCMRQYRENLDGEHDISDCFGEYFELRDSAWRVFPNLSRCGE